MPSERTVLCCVSQYKEKYFFNDALGLLPANVKKEILEFMFMLTEEAGGISILGFTEQNEIYLDSSCEEGDLGYDNISAGLIIREIEREHRDLFDQLQVWYNTLKKI